MLFIVSIKVLTSLSNQQKEPDTPCNIQEQRNGVGWILEKIHDSVHDIYNFLSEPGDFGICKYRPFSRWLLVFR